MTFKVGVVITVAPGRTPNLRRVLDSLEHSTQKPRSISLIWDGHDPQDLGHYSIPIHNRQIPKHEPGLEQPRNVGVRLLRHHDPACGWVWFLDSDVEVEPHALAAYQAAYEANPVARIMVGPYEFLPEGVRGRRPDVRTDCRWVSFDEHPPDEITFHPTGAGMACLGGNLVWPIDEFDRVGGFWNGLHHGRCEDGELGIRAVMAGVGVSFVRDARGYHQYHDRDDAEIQRRNTIDVPKLNRRHPFMPDGVGTHLLMTAKDGIRFDFKCPGCSKRMNSLLFWEHCGGTNWECPDA